MKEKFCDVLAAWACQCWRSRVQVVGSTLPEKLAVHMDINTLRYFIRPNNRRVQGIDLPRDQGHVSGLSPIDIPCTVPRYIYSNTLINYIIFNIIYN